MFSPRIVAIESSHSALRKINALIASVPVTDSILTFHILVDIHLDINVAITLIKSHPEILNNDLSLKELLDAQEALDIIWQSSKGKHVSGPESFINNLNEFLNITASINSHFPETLTHNDSEFKVISLDELNRSENSNVRVEILNELKIAVDKTYHHLYSIKRNTVVAWDQHVKFAIDSGLYDPNASNYYDLLEDGKSHSEALEVLNNTHRGISRVNVLYSSKNTKYEGDLASFGVFMLLNMSELRRLENLSIKNTELFTSEVQKQESHSLENNQFQTSQIKQYSNADISIIQNAKKKYRSLKNCSNGLIVKTQSGQSNQEKLSKDHVIGSALTNFLAITTSWVLFIICCLTATYFAYTLLNDTGYLVKSPTPLGALLVSAITLSLLPVVRKYIKEPQNILRDESKDETHVFKVTTTYVALFLFLVPLVYINLRETPNTKLDSPIIGTALPIEADRGKSGENSLNVFSRKSLNALRNADGVDSSAVEHTVDIDKPFYHPKYEKLGYKIDWTCQQDELVTQLVKSEMRSQGFTPREYSSLENGDPYLRVDITCNPTDSFDSDMLFFDSEIMFGRKRVGLEDLLVDINFGILGLFRYKPIMSVRFTLSIEQGMRSALDAFLMNNT